MVLSMSAYYTWLCAFFSCSVHNDFNVAIFKSAFIAPCDMGSYSTREGGDLRTMHLFSGCWFFVPEISWHRLMSGCFVVLIEVGSMVPRATRYNALSVAKMGDLASRSLMRRVKPANVQPYGRVWWVHSFIVGLQTSLYFSLHSSYWFLTADFCL